MAAQGVFTNRSTAIIQMRQTVKLYSINSIWLNGDITLSCQILHNKLMYFSFLQKLEIIQDVLQLALENITFKHLHITNVP